MDILLVERDRLIRDQVKVGLQQFPEFTVTTGEGHAGLNKLRSHSFDAIFLGIPPEGKDRLKLVEHLRSFDFNTDLVVMTEDKSVKDLAKVKSRFNVSSFLSTPISAVEFFRLVARIRERHLDSLEAAGPLSGAGARSRG
ncbi:MAG: response regulator [Planctomycetota bacterium]|jgi:DNA-binding NtrC family response regulator